MKDANSNPNQQKVFDDYTVDCNKCSHYWDSSCDGTPVGSERPCTAYKATRSVIYPAKIKTLQKGLERLRMGFWFLLGYLVTLHIWLVITL